MYSFSLVFNFFLVQHNSLHSPHKIFWRQYFDKMLNDLYFYLLSLSLMLFNVFGIEYDSLQLHLYAIGKKLFEIDFIYGTVKRIPL